MSSPWARRSRRRGSRTCRSGRCSPRRRRSRSPRVTPRCTRRSPATGCASRSTARSREATVGAGAPVAHPGAGVGRGDRPVDGGDRPRGGEPLLPRAAAAARGAPRRHAAHDDRGRRAAREPRQGGAPADRARAAADPHRRPGRSARCSTSRAARCCRCATSRPATPGDEVGGAADLDAEPLQAAADGLDLAAYRAAVPGPHFDAVPDGWAVEIEGGDVVDSAPALARLTLNVAMAHLDAGLDRRRPPARLRRARDRARRRRRRRARCRRW